MLIGVEKATAAGIRREAAIENSTAYGVFDNRGNPLYRAESRGAALAMLTNRQIKEGWTIQPSVRSLSLLEVT